MKNIVKWFLDLIKKRKRRKDLKRKLKEMKKRDPFTYTH